MDHEQRDKNVVDHTVKIAALLETPTIKEVPQRIWRAHFYDTADEYVLVTLVQNLNIPTPPNQMPIKAHAFAARSYRRSVNGPATARLDLYGDYSIAEIVVFLGLDEVMSSTLDWIDETRYSKLIVVGTMIGKSLN